jgi:hypothetical protein
MIDFEEGLYRAVKEIFLNTIIIGCYYHYKAALNIKIKKLKKMIN